MRFSLSAACCALAIGQASYSTSFAQTAPPSLATARQQLVHHDYAAASTSYQQALTRPGRGTARDYYQAAQAAARNHEPQRALDWLAQAVTKGYYAETQLRAEEDFTSLTAQPAWARLLTQARTKQQQHEKAFDPALVALLKKIHYQDQQYRLVAAAAERKYGINAPQITEGA